MSENRVIGHQGRIPWHLAEDFKWFKKMTTGQVIVMGRKTFESIGKPLPNRTTIVLSRSQLIISGARVASSLDEIDPNQELCDTFVCGGAQIYVQALPRCSDLFLTRVKRKVEGDAFFPPFEEHFNLIGEILDRPDFKILHFQNRKIRS